MSWRQLPKSAAASDVQERRLSITASLFPIRGSLRSSGSSSDRACPERRSLVAYLRRRRLHAFFFFCNQGYLFIYLLVRDSGDKSRLPRTFRKNLRASSRDPLMRPGPGSRALYATEPLSRSRRCKRSPLLYPRSDARLCGSLVFALCIYLPASGGSPHLTSSARLGKRNDAGLCSAFFIPVAVV